MQGEETFELANIVMQTRGTILIDKDFHQFFKQNKNKTASGKTRWRCSQYRKNCKAKLVTVGDYIVYRLSVHNHPT